MIINTINPLQYFKDKLCFPDKIFVSLMDLKQRNGSYFCVVKACLGHFILTSVDPQSKEDLQLREKQQTWLHMSCSLPEKNKSPSSHSEVFEAGPMKMHWSLEDGSGRRDRLSSCSDGLLSDSQEKSSTGCQTLKLLTMNKKMTSIYPKQRIDCTHNAMWKEVNWWCWT